MDEAGKKAIRIADDEKLGSAPIKESYECSDE